MSNLGNLLAQQHDLASARRLLERALALRRQQHGPHDADVGTDLGNLGIVLMELDELDSARELFERAIGIHRAVFGDHHPNSVSALRPTRAARIQGEQPLGATQPILDNLRQLREVETAPMYVQIERCIRVLVANGSLQVGQRLPPVRSLARQLGLAPNTVARAYAELVGEGVVDARAGGGSIVASPLRRQLVTRADQPRERLEVHGLVAQPRFLSRDDLAQLPRATLQQPFACDEGWVVPDLHWSGVWLADVLALAEPLVTARYVRVCAGTYGLPLSLAEVPDALLADELDGEPLVIEHGAPWRVVLSGGACYTSVKWVDRLELALGTSEQWRA